MSNNAILSLTEAAKARVNHLVSVSKEPVIGIRVGVSKGGCSGLTYKIDYAKEVVAGDEVIELNEQAKILVESNSILYLLGTTMDYIEETLSSRFVFQNPNEKNTCGCGESFNV